MKKASRKIGTPKQRVVFQCNFCQHIWKRMISPKTFEVVCPKCKEIDTEIIGITE